MNIMKLGVVKEKDGESRVAIVPSSLRKLNKIGFDVLVESGAGSSSHHLDSEYEDAGAKITDRQTALDSEVWSGIGHAGGSSSDNSYVPMTFTWCDHPNTTSAVEYRVQSLTNSSSSTVYTYRLQYMTLW